METDYNPSLRMWKKVLFVLSVLLGLAAMATIPHFVGIDKIRVAIARTGTLSLVIFTLFAGLPLVIPAIGWWIIMRGEGIRASLWQALKANFMGFPINMIAPSAYLGAEPLKTIYIARVCDVTKRRVLATIIVAKVQEVAGLALGMLLSAIVYMWRVDLGRRDRVTVSIVTAVMVLGMAGVMIMFFRNAQPSVKVINFLARFGFARRKLARLRPKAEEMEHMIHACFMHRWRRFLVAQAVTLLSAISLFFRPWVYFILDVHPDLHLIDSQHLAAIYVITNSINTVSITPGGLGVFEAGLLLYFAKAKLGADNALAYAFANRIFDITYVLWGLWLIVHTGLTGVAKGIAKGTDQTIKPEDQPTAADV